MSWEWKFLTSDLVYSHKVPDGWEYIVLNQGENRELKTKNGESLSRSFPSTYVLATLDIGRNREFVLCYDPKLVDRSTVEKLLMRKNPKGQDTLFRQGP